MASKTKQLQNKYTWNKMRLWKNKGYQRKRENILSLKNIPLPQSASSTAIQHEVHETNLKNIWDVSLMWLKTSSHHSTSKQQIWQPTKINSVCMCNTESTFQYGKLENASGRVEIIG